MAFINNSSNRSIIVKPDGFCRVKDAYSLAGDRREHNLANVLITAPTALDEILFFFNFEETLAFELSLMHFLSKLDQEFSVLGLLADHEQELLLEDHAALDVELRFQFLDQFHQLLGIDVQVFRVQFPFGFDQVGKTEGLVAEFAQSTHLFQTDLQISKLFLKILVVGELVWLLPIELTGNLFSRME